MSRPKSWMMAALGVTFGATVSTGAYAYSATLDVFEMQPVWQPKIPPGGSAVSIAVDTDGSVYATSEKWSSGAQRDFYLEKFDSAGGLVWTVKLEKTFSGIFGGGELALTRDSVLVHREPLVDDGSGKKGFPGSVVSSYSKSGEKVADSENLHSNITRKVTVQTGGNIWVGDCGPNPLVKVFDKALKVVATVPVPSCLLGAIPRAGGGVIGIGRSLSTHRSSLRAFDAAGVELWSATLAQGQESVPSAVVLTNSRVTTVTGTTGEKGTQYIEQFSLSGSLLHSEEAKLEGCMIFSGVALDNGGVLLGASDEESTMFIELDPNGHQVARSKEVPGIAWEMVRDGDRIVVAGVGDNGMQAYELPK